MKILLIDTSLSNLTIAITEENKLLCSKSIKLNKDFSIYTISYIEGALNAVNIKPADIDTIMVFVGPGSFTGTRIGVTIAKVFAWCLNVKIIPISSLKALALSVDNFEYAVSVIDAKSNSYYVAIYNQNYEIIFNEQYISKAELIDKIYELNGKIKIVSDNELNIDDIKILNVELDVLKIVQYHTNENGVNPHELAPNYLKMMDI